MKDQVVFSEKKLRDAIQAILFERTLPIVSCDGPAWDMIH